MSDSIGSMDTDRPSRIDRVRQIVKDCIRRRTDGEVVTDEFLLSAHPDLMPELGEQLRNLSLIQEAQRRAQDTATCAQRGLHIRCPHCNNAIEIVDETVLSDVLCPSCGSHFSLVSDAPWSFQADELETIGHYKLLDKLGVGAFGSVWSARDIELDRMVAIKIPRKGEMSAEDSEKFLREARAAAQLAHPNIVRVYEVGRHEDRMYIVSDLVQGINLADWLTDQRAAPREAAELCATVAGALDHAHGHGVIHRDLKPENIMLDGQGEPHIMDFGLAKREAGEVTMTVEGKLLGTPAYMSPEQARGGAHQADRRTDIYSLGVILFELLTGERPFRGSTQMLVHHVLFDEPPSPRRLNSRIPRDLETICLKCLEKEPNRRYQTAGQLRDDLQRFLRGEPVVARPITQVARAWRWCKRNRALAATSAAVATLVLVFAIGGPLVAVRHKQSAENYRRLLYISDMASAREAWERSDIDTVAELLRRHQPGPGQSDLRGFEWFHLWQISRYAAIAPTFEGRGFITDVLFSDEGNTLTVLSNHGMKRWDVSTRELLDSYPQDALGISRYRSRLSSDGRLAAHGHDDGAISIVNLQSRKSHTFAGHDVAVLSLAISAGGHYLATGDMAGSVKLWKFPTGKFIAPIDGHSGRVYDIAFAADGSTMITGSRDQTVKLWAIPTGKLLHTFDLRAHCQERSSAWSVAISRDGKTVAAGTSGDFVVLLWDIEGAQLIYRLEGHTGNVRALAFSPNGKRLASGSPDEIRLWDVETGRVQTELKVGRRNRSLSFTRDGMRLASGEDTGITRLWDLSDLPDDNILRGHTDNVRCLAISPDGRMLASGSASGELKIWSLKRPFVARDLVEEVGSIESVNFSPDGLVLASTHDKLVHLWDVATGKRLRELAHDGPVNCVRYSRDGELLAAGGLDASANKERSGLVTLWNTTTFQKTASLTGHRDQVCSLAFSSDGQTLATGCGNYAGLSESRDTSVRIWDLKSLRLKSNLEGHTGDVLSIAFSPDGAMLATAAADYVVRLWNTSDWEPVVTIKEEAWVRSVVFTADGRRLITTSERPTVKCWDVATGQLCFRLDGHFDTVSAAAIPRDGRILATGSDDDTIRLWQAATPDEVQAAGW